MDNFGTLPPLGIRLVFQAQPDGHESRGFVVKRKIGVYRATTFLRPTRRYDEMMRKARAAVAVICEGNSGIPFPPPFDTFVVVVPALKAEVVVLV